jgi:hypothetical protein
VAFGAPDNEYFAYDHFFTGYVYPFYTGPDFSNEQRSFYESADAPLWNADDPLGLSLKEGHPPTKVSTTSCSTWHHSKTRENNTRCGGYVIMMRCDFYSSDFEDMMQTYVRSWPSDGGE